MKILLLADASCDKYVFGTVRRYNPEGGFPILDMKAASECGGMGCNVESNLKAMGHEVVAVYGNRVSDKCRLVDTESNRIIARMDHDDISDPIQVPKNAGRYDAIVVADYGKGSIDSTVFDRLSHIKVPQFIDTRRIDGFYADSATVKVNEREFTRLKSYPLNLIVTHGSRGSSYRGKTYPTLPTAEVDPAGAGDVFMAAYVHATMTEMGGNDYAMLFANYCAAISVGKLGVYTLTSDDIEYAADMVRITHSAFR
jgi:bifunctional ADP-heptose synthase (sugar kinase/adenylyltransferase)